MSIYLELYENAIVKSLYLRGTKGEIQRSEYVCRRLGLTMNDIDLLTAKFVRGILTNSNGNKRLYRIEILYVLEKY